MKKLALLTFLLLMLCGLSRTESFGANPGFSILYHGFSKTPSNNATLDETAITKNSGPVDYVRLRIHDGPMTDEIIIRFLPLATDTFDSYYDAFKILGSGTQFSSTTYADTSIYYSINALCNILQTPDVPLRFRADSAGTFSISAHEFRSFPPTINITLEDLRDNVIKDIRTDSVYTFTGSPADDPFRFVIHFTQCAAIPVSISIDQGTSLTVCAGTNVALTTTGIGGGISPAYQWYVNGVATGGNTPSFSSTNLANGAQIYCKYTSSAVCAGNNPAFSDTMVVTVNPLPGAPLSITMNQGNALTICAGSSVQLTTSQTGGGNSPVYQWYVNGTTTGSNNNSFTLNNVNNGDQIWCRITTSEICASVTQAYTDTMTVTVVPVPPLPVSVNINQVSPVQTCAGSSVTLTTNAIGGGSSPSFQWYINGNPGGTNASSIVLNNPQSGDQVWCVLTSSDACATNNPATSGQVMVIVNPVPVTPLSITINQGNTLSICSGAVVTLTTTQTGGGNAPVYQWFQNGNPTGSNSGTLTLTNLADGDQIWCRITTSEVCAQIPQSLSDTMSVSVNPLPAVPVSVSIDQGLSLTVCAGASIALSTTSVGGGSNPGYEWYVNGNFAGTSDSYSNNNPANGDRIWCVYTSSDPCAFNNPAISDTMVVTVNPVPVNPVTVSIDQGTSMTVCSGFDVTFTTTESGGGSTPGYQWYLNGNIVGSNNDSLMLNTLQDGDQVLCRITTSDVCALVYQSYSDTMVVTVLPTSPVPVSVAINQGTAITLCEGTAETFSVSGTGGGSNPVYEWYVNGVAAGVNDDTITLVNLEDGDIIICKLTSSDVCIFNNPAYSDTLVTTVFPVPATPVITQFGTDLVSDALTGNQWYNENGPISGATDQVFTPTVDGYYYVIVTEQGCSSAPSNQIHILIQGIEEGGNAMMLELLPNPNKGEFVVFTPKTITEEVVLEIFNATGKKVFDKKLPGLSGYGINLPDLNVGVYYLNVRTSKGQTVMQFVVTK